MTTSRFRRALAFAALAAALAACAKPLRKDQNALSNTPTAPDGGAQAGQGLEPDVRDRVMARSADLDDIFFAYDSSRLSAATRATLERNAGWLKAHASARVQIAGYCDARGTVEYNLALGQRRAAAVRDFYAALGVERDRVATISYGKERASCSAATEKCWSRERRAETLLAVSADVSRGLRPSAAHR